MGNGAEGAGGIGGIRAVAPTALLARTGCMSVAAGATEGLGDEGSERENCLWLGRRPAGMQISACVNMHVAATNRCPRRGRFSGGSGSWTKLSGASWGVGYWVGLPKTVGRSLQGTTNVRPRRLQT